MPKFFVDAFAVDGDKTAIPDSAPVDGSVSYDIGFGIKYQQDPATTGLDIPRDQFNQLMFDVTENVQQWQLHGFADWVGTPSVAYDANATVRHAGVNYFSLVNGNTDEPPSANWGVVIYNTQSFFSGDVMETYSNILPDGWLWVDGKTIGSGASGATSRANSDTISLFTVLWNSLTNSVLPIQNSDGTAGSRGISAAADFSANKRLPLIDRRGRVAAALDNLGGTPANRLNNFPQGGINGTIPGAFGGEANHALSSAENGSHFHDGSALSTNTVSDHIHPLTTGTTGGPGITTGNGQGTSPTPGFPTATGPAGAHSHTITGSTGSSGLGTAHNTVQPTIAAYFRIKL